MVNNRVLAAAFGVLLVGWYMVRWPIGFFLQLPALVGWVDFVTYSLILIFTPAVMLKARWTALGAMVAGVVRILIGIYGTITLPMSYKYGPVVGFLLGLIFTYFSFRAYREK